MRLSIIIPVYNVEKYIRGTLQSVYGQRCDESLFEVIVVNDGTPDGSMAIVEEYRKCHGNLSVINQPNKGLGEARNIGMKRAKGKYLWFVDGDDCISDGCLRGLEDLLATARADVLAFDVVRVRERNGTEEEVLDKLCYKSSQCRLYGRELGRDDTVNVLKEAFVQRFMFKRDFLESCGLSFFPGIYHEDNEFMPRAMFHARDVIFVEKACYRYRIRENGNIMSLKSTKRIKDRLQIIDNLRTFRSEHAKVLKDKCFLDFYIFSLVRGLVCEQGDFGEEGRGMVRSEYRRFRLLAANAVRASLYYRLPGGVLKACAAVVNPSWVKSLEKRAGR